MSTERIKVRRPVKGDRFRVIQPWFGFDMVPDGTHANCWKMARYEFAIGDIITFHAFERGWGSDPAMATKVAGADGAIHTSYEGWSVDPHLDPANGYVEVR